MLKYLLLEGLEDAGTWRRRWRHAPQGVGPQLYACLEAHLHSWLGVWARDGWEELAVIKGLTATPRYCQRVIELAAAEVLSERLAPEVCIAPAPVAAENLGLDGRWCHAVCFVAAPLFTHEFYPLVVDALASDAARGSRPDLALLGVHLDWLSPRGEIERLLVLDAARDRFCECALDHPLAPHSAQFLCLGRQEQVLHARWSARLTCPQLNPAGAAAVADDKARTLAGWLAAGVPVPAWQGLAPGEVAPARRLLQARGEVVIKPNQATEGEGVAFFSAQAGAEMDGHLTRLWEQGEVLLQERADGLLYRDPQTNAAHTLALRLNVARAGGRCWAESGYAQVGADAHRPAAGSQGSRLCPIEEVLPHLVQRRDGQPVPVSSASWDAVLRAAEQAALLFPALLLVGLDLVLVSEEAGMVKPIFLEANPRPAGLSHARFVQGPERGMPGVSLKVWEGLAELVQAAGGGMR